MSDTEPQDGLAAAQARFDAAMARLDRSVKDLNARMRQLNRIEVDTQRTELSRTPRGTTLPRFPVPPSCVAFPRIS